MLNLVLRGAFTRVAIGLVLGVPLAVGAGRLLAAQLYGVTFWDPLALAVAAGSLTLCAFVAALIPGQPRGVDSADARAPIGIARRSWRSDGTGPLNEAAGAPPPTR